jgi:hypothetical protein
MKSARPPGVEHDERRGEDGREPIGVIRSALTKDPDLNHRQINLLWSQAGHAGEITKVLFYQVRRKMGLKRAEYRWVLDDDRR